jgi:hypothetical protein
MQPPTTVQGSTRVPDRYFVRPAGVLAELLGESEIGEDELLLKMRELGLIVYPSPLLGGLIEKLPEVLAAEVLSQLDPTDVVLFGQADRACRAAVMAFGVPQETPTSVSVLEDGSMGEGTEGGPLLLRVEDFVGSVERVAWAKDRGCPWNKSVCEYAAEGGNLEVLKWARERRCPWDERTCFHAAEGGHLEVLQWAREHGCEWDAHTCMSAADGGHLDVLRWAHEHGCPWDEWTCFHAAMSGHLHILQWAREHGCPWSSGVCTFAAMRGHLEVLRRAREHHCPWTERTCEWPLRAGTWRC